MDYIRSFFRTRPAKAPDNSGVSETLAQQLRQGRRGPAAGFPRFRSTATDQFDLRQPDRFSSVRVRLRSVFTPSQPVTDRRVFAGRTGILNSLIQALEDFRLHVVLYGERGLGKTSVLHVLAQAARDARYLVVYMPCGASSSFDEVFRSIAASIPLLFHGSVDPTSSDAEKGRTLADILPSGPLTPRTASEMLAKVVGTRVIVVLDEFDRCESENFRLSVAELIKNLSDRSVRVQLVIAGVAANLAELIEYIPSIQRNIYALQIPRMDAGEIRELVKNGEAVTGLRFDDAAVDGIVAVANGFPYFASLLSHYAGLNAIDALKTTVTRSDVVAAIRSAISEFKGRISKLTLSQISNSASEGQLQILGVLAGVAQMSGGHFEFEEVRPLMTADMTERAQRLVEAFASKNVLFSACDDATAVTYRFTDEAAIPYVWLLAADARLREVATIKPAPASASRHSRVS
jgi:Cdc6-like AAA superfamily ATPase